MVQYTVQVYTGKKFGSGTDASVFINIHGEQGDTGDRPLVKSGNNVNKFEAGNVSRTIFHVTSVLARSLCYCRLLNWF